jgi:uncharacterized protein (TIGR00297 family)
VHETNETLRKLLHIAFGALALTLKVLNWRIAALIALAAAVGNWLLLHRLVGKRVARHERGWDVGIVLYPIAVLGLIVVFNRHLEIAAIAWVILAVGDGMANLVGRSSGGLQPAVPGSASRSGALPWNREKSWMGLLAFIAFGFPAAWGTAYSFGAVNLLAIGVAVLAAALVESLPLRVNDNLSVPLVAAGTLAAFMITPPFDWASRPPITGVWLIVNTLLALLGLALRTVDFSGALAGWILGSVIIIGGGPALYVALLAFFVVGTLATRLGYRAKAHAGLAQEKGGRRGAGHAIANVGVAALCAIACWRGLGLVPLFMGIASLATAAADTVASEIGQLFGRRTFLPLTFRRVERGTEGAISLEGTLAGLAAALVVAVAGTAVAVHQLRRGFIASIEIDRTHAVMVVTLCGVLGSYLESVIGSVTRGIPNHVMNFMNTALGALLFWIAWHFVPMFGTVF